MEIEIGSYLNKVSEGRLSPESKMRISGMLRIISEIESIADSCFNIAKTLSRKNTLNVKFEEPVLKEIDAMFNLVTDAMTNMLGILREMETPDGALVVKAYMQWRRLPPNFRNIAHE